MGNFYQLFSPSTGGSRALTQACTTSMFNYWAIPEAPSPLKKFWVYVQVYMHVEASDNFGVITQEPPTLFSQRKQVNSYLYKQLIVFAVFLSLVWG